MKLTFSLDIQMVIKMYGRYATLDLIVYGRKIFNNEIDFSVDYI